MAIWWKKVTVFTQLIHCLTDRIQSLILWDASDNGGKALAILIAQYMAKRSNSLLTAMVLKGLPVYVRVPTMGWIELLVLDNNTWNHLIG